MKRILFSLLLVTSGLSGQTFSNMPGVVISHSPAKSKIYIGSPSITKLDDGRYIASHDHFIPSEKNKSCITFIYCSDDEGKTWKQMSSLIGQTWSKLFTLGDKLYIIGPSDKGSDIVIRMSSDGGETWTIPWDRHTGRIVAGGFHTAPTPLLIHNGRVWKAVEDINGPKGVWAQNYRARVISAPMDANLLEASNWKISNAMGHDSTYLDNKYGGWLEGNAVAAPDGSVVNVLRTDYRVNGDEKAAILNLNADGTTLTIDKTSAFINMPGACKKFGILYDAKSKKYWSLSNYVPKALRDGNIERTRNTLALITSENLYDWDVHSIVLHHEDVAKHGFQYADFLFEGDDIIFVSRTAYEDGQEGADNQHNANFLTFHRIKDFRNYSTPKQWKHLMP